MEIELLEVRFAPGKECGTTKVLETLKNRPEEHTLELVTNIFHTVSDHLVIFV